MTRPIRPSNLFLLIEWANGCHAHACVGMWGGFPMVSRMPTQAWAWHPTIINRN